MLNGTDPVDAVCRRAATPDSDTEVAAVIARLTAMIPSDGALRPVLAWHLAASGAMSRARLALRLGGALGLRPETAIDLATVSQAVHEASLLLDDINDRSQTRRGRPTAWVRFGQDQAMLAAVRLVTSAQRLAMVVDASNRSSPSLAAIVGSVVEEALDGQATELIELPRDWAKYDWIVRRKTGGLMALPILLAAQAAGLKRETVGSLQQFAGQLGLAYQIADDIADGGFNAHDWADVMPTPQQRLDALIAQIRIELADLPRALSGALDRLIDDLLS